MRQDFRDTKKNSAHPVTERVVSSERIVVERWWRSGRDYIFFMRSERTGSVQRPSSDVQCTVTIHLYVTRPYIYSASASIRALYVVLNQCNAARSAV